MPDAGLLRKLAYLADQDSDSIVATGFHAGDAGAEAGDGKANRDMATLEFLAQQDALVRDQMKRLNERLDALEARSRQALLDAENDLAEALSNANRASDGTAVFMDLEGQIRDETGEIVDPSLVDMDQWDSTGTTWDALRSRQQSVARAHETHERILDARTRFDTGDLDGDDLAALSDELDALAADMNTDDQVKVDHAVVEPETTAPHEPRQSAVISAPQPF